LQASSRVINPVRVATTTAALRREDHLFVSAGGSSTLVSLACEAKRSSELSVCAAGSTLLKLRPSFVDADMTPAVRILFPAKALDLPTWVRCRPFPTGSCGVAD